MGYGGFNFLDAKGFRYYLAPTMVRGVQAAEGQELAWKLNLDGEANRDAYRLNQWSLLDGRQRLCVRRFAEFMVAVSLSGAYEHRDWKRALESYWANATDAPTLKVRTKPKPQRSRNLNF